MLVELNAYSQITVPKSVIKDLNLQQGAMFDLQIVSGNIVLVPVVVYPKAKIEELEKALKASAQNNKDSSGDSSDLDDLIDGLSQGLH